MNKQEKEKLSFKEKLKRWREKKRKKKEKKKLKKKQRKFTYKVIHQKQKPKSNLLFFMELFWATLADIFVGILKFLMAMVITLCIFIVIGGIYSKIMFNTYFVPIYDHYFDQALDIVAKSSKEDFAIDEGSVIYDKNGEVLATLYENKPCKYLTYNEIPKDVVNAFVAIEDRSFWTNDGVDYKGMARVLYRYIKTKGQEAHGASTITQQLARGTYLTRDVSLDRKAKEILVAQLLTTKYSKEEIMEFYVNTCCYSNGIYGIEGAARAYFDKSANELTLAESAFLCAIPNRPNYFDPYIDKTRLYDRQHKILKDMKTCGFITDEQYDEAIAQEIVITKPKRVFNDTLGSYAIDCAIKYLMKLDNYEFKYKFNTEEEFQEYHNQYNKDYAEYRQKLNTGGYQIYTSLDQDIYEYAQEILNRNLSEYDETINENTNLYELQGALTIIDNDTHKVIAVVGGRNVSNNYVYSFNRAYQSFRQPGSCIKPIVVYAPALMNGYTANSTVYNINVTEAKKKDANPQEMYGTAMTLRYAVEQSKNGVAWRLLDELKPRVGLGYIEHQRFSYLCPGDYNDSSALGGLTHGVSTEEMASAYETLANHGYYCAPTCIEHFYKGEKDLYKESEQEKIYSAEAADDMVDICKGVLTVGTASKQKWYNETEMPAFGKTGTTNDNKDIWFCGSTPYYSIAVWVGYDTPREMTNIYGGSYPATIWKEVMLSLIDGKEVKDFTRLYNEYDTPNYENGYQYLEGRSDDEVLSEGYTVRNYRDDRLIGEKVYDVINEMNSLELTSPTYYDDLNELYSKGKAIIDTIYSRKYTIEMTDNLQAVYDSRINQH